MRRRNEGWIEAFGDNSWSLERDSNGRPSGYIAVILWSPPQSFVRSTLLCSGASFRKWRISGSEQIINASPRVWLNKITKKKNVIRNFWKRMSYNPDKIVAYLLCDRGSIHVAFLFNIFTATCSVVSRGCCGFLGCGAECSDPPKWRRHLPVDILSYPRFFNLLAPELFFFFNFSTLCI